MGRVTSDIYKRGDTVSIPFVVVKINEDEENIIVAIAPAGADDETEAWLNLPEDQLSEISGQAEHQATADELAAVKTKLEQVMAELEEAKHVNAKLEGKLEALSEKAAA